jgi:tetratricopeptide (TPR) repeat protein
MHAVARKLVVVTALIIGSNAIALQAYRAASTREDSNYPNTATSPLEDIDQVINGLERQIQIAPTSSSLDLLARMQLARGRITGDAQSYTKAQTAAERSLAIAPGNVEARTLDTEIRFTNHEFVEARSRSAAIVAENPKELAALGIRGDAERELGDYAAATKTLDELRRIAPNSASVLVREARLAFLEGDTVRANRLAERAEFSAQQSGLLSTTRAFYPSFQGQLAFDQGNYNQSIKHFERARRIANDDRVASLGLGRALAAKGEITKAVEIVRELTNRFPDPVALSFLGDLHTKQGDLTAAENAYALVEAVAALATANKQIYNRELSLFYANHGRKLNEALRLARAEISERKDIYGYDALAWAEYHANHFEQADAAMKKALSYGTKDARLEFHAGMIASALGDRAGAKQHLAAALKISPHFDVLAADMARNKLSQL